MPLQSLGQMSGMGGSERVGGNPTSAPSFIPKKPLVAPTVKREAGWSGVLMLAAVLVFITAGIGWGGVYFYKASLQSGIESIKKDLGRAKEAYSDQIATINAMVNLDSKLKIVRQLLNAHSTLEPLFKLLNDSTIKSLRYKDFSYLNVDNSKIDIKASGEAKSYSSIALEAQELADTKGLRDIIFSDLNPGITGNVVFKMTASVDKDLLNYKEMLNKATE